MTKKTVITYGTYDLFHEGHKRLLERAKALGDRLIVGVTTDNYDDSRGKLNVQQSLMQRIENVKNSGMADEVIIEEYEGQKVNDIQKYKVDIFAIGSDWLGKFDYLNEYCKVVYLERTKGISSTELRNSSNGVLRIGVVGNGRIASRFVYEARYVSGVNVEGVFGRNEKKLKQFINDHDLSFCSTNYDEFLKKVDAVYIASPHTSHYDYAKRALDHGLHVLCEKPMTLSKKESSDLFDLAKTKELVCLEAIKTAYSPGFIRMVAVAKSGSIGRILSVDATFTKLVAGKTRELSVDEAGGSVTELATYPLLAAVKLLGKDIQTTKFHSFYGESLGVDLFTKIDLDYRSSTATLKVGLGAKSEGDLVVTGTKGYVYVPAPWWKTEYFEVRYENPIDNKKYYYKFDGDGLRYEVAEFVSLINRGTLETHKLTTKESLAIAGVIDEHRRNKHVRKMV